MRQQWVAQWEDQGQQKTRVFTSLEYEVIARVSFQLLLMEQDIPVPNAYTVEKFGEPFDDRRRLDDRI